MFTDNDDCDYLTGIPGHPFAGVSVQTVPEPWSFRLAGGDCGGPESGTLFGDVPGFMKSSPVHVVPAAIGPAPLGWVRVDGDK